MKKATNLRQLIISGLLMVTIILLVAGCGSPTSTGTSNGTETPIVTALPFKLPGGSANISELPQDLLDAYSNFTMPVDNSNYANFKAVEPPWKIALILPYMVNTFMQQTAAAMQQEIDTLEAQGLVSDYYFADANFDLPTQIQQVQTAIEKGVDLIIIEPLSPDGLNTVFEQAYDAGIVVVCKSNISTSPYVVNSGVNFVQACADQAGLIATGLNGKGNVLVVNGVTGMSANTLCHDGAVGVLSLNPGIEIVGEVDGQWSDTVAQTVMTEWLATHTDKVDAVWQCSYMFVGIINAFEQAGRPIPNCISFFTPLQASIAYSVEHLSSGWTVAGSCANPPDASMDGAVAIGLYTLMGYGPKYNTILQLAYPINNSNIAEWMQTGFKYDGTGAVAEPPASKPFFGYDMLSHFFTQPITPLETAFRNQ
jgi:ribose transport system substrate-binding protein